MSKGTENTAREAIDKKLTPLYKTAATTNTTSAIRLFLEANLEFSGIVNIPIISLYQKDFENADNDKLQRLTLEMYCFEALSHQKVRNDTEKAILKKYGNRISSVKIEISSSEDGSQRNANAHVEIMLPERG